MRHLQCRLLDFSRDVVTIAHENDMRGGKTKQKRGKINKSNQKKDKSYFFSIGSQISGYT